MSSPQAKGVPGRIGPNAIIRTAEALRVLEGRQQADRVFEMAHLDRYLGNLPEQMIDECEVTTLHHALCDLLGHDRAGAVSAMAGRLTGDYLMRHRIPTFVQNCAPSSAIPACQPGPVGCDREPCMDVRGQRQVCRPARSPCDLRDYGLSALPRADHASRDMRFLCGYFRAVVFKPRSPRCAHCRGCLRSQGRHRLRV